MYYNKQTGKFYERNVDGTKGSEIKMSPTIYRGTFSSPTTATKSITVTHNLNLDTSKAELRLYGNGSAAGYSFQQNFGMYVKSFGKNSFVVENASVESSYVLVGNFSYEITYWG